MPRKRKAARRALMVASLEGHLDIVQALLAKGADVNAKATDGSTPLMFAALGHDDAIAQLLPSSPSSKDDRLDIVQGLLAKGAGVDAKQEHGMTALMAAPFKGHLDVV